MFFKDTASDRTLEIRLVRFRRCCRVGLAALQLMLDRGTDQGLVLLARKSSSRRDRRRSRSIFSWSIC